MTSWVSGDTLRHMWNTDETTMQSCRHITVFVLIYYRVSLVELNDMSWHIQSSSDQSRDTANALSSNNSIYEEIMKHLSTKTTLPCYVYVYTCFNYIHINKINNVTIIFIYNVIRYMRKYGPRDDVNNMYYIYLNCYIVFIYLFLFFFGGGGEYKFLQYAVFWASRFHR